MLTLYFDNKVNWKNQFFSITCPCYETKVWEVFQFFFLVVKIMLTHLCLKFFEDWHQTDLKKFDLKKKKWFQNTKKKKFLFSFIYLFIYLSIHLFLQGGGRWGELGGRRLKDLTMQHVESSYICWIQVLDTISQNLKKNINQ